MNFDVVNQTFTAAQNQNSFTSIDLALDGNNDLVVLPNGYLGIVTGSLKLQQDCRIFLQSPKGSCIIDSGWGNAALNLLGQAPMSPATLRAAVHGALTTLKYYKDQEETSRGYPLENSELISSIQDVSVTPAPDNVTWNVVVTVFDKDNAGVSFAVSLT